MIPTPSIDELPQPAVPARGQGELGPGVERFDRWADAALEVLRGHRVADQVFIAATTVGDFSLIWHLLNSARGATSERRANQAFVFAAVLGVESLLVNQGLKRLFDRKRPLPAGDPRFDIRRPSTSAFPSGHSSAAGFAAFTLTALTGRRFAPAWWGVGLTVAVSRAYVRVHHPSDVVAGLAVGTALAAGVRGLAKATAWRR